MLSSRRIILPLFLISTLFASAPGDSLVWKGVKQFYNYQTAEAIDLLARARTEYPENPTVHLTWAAARWLHSQANDSVETTYTVLEESLNDIIPVYNTLVRQYPDDPMYQLYQGSAIGLRARVNLGRKEWFSTLSDAYKGFRIIRDVAEEHPEMTDAQLPIGIVETYASMSGWLVRWSASIFGLNPDKTEGLAKIEASADSDGFAWIEASSIKSFLDLWVYTDLPDALKHSQKLAQEFPRNYYFNIMYVESLIRSEDTQKAKIQLSYLNEQFSDLTSIQKDWYEGYLEYEEGLFAAMNGDWETAYQKSVQAIEGYGAELDVVLGNAWLLKGLSLDALQDHDGAQEAYQACLDLDNLTKAMELADYYSDHPFQPGQNIWNIEQGTSVTSP